MSTNYYDLQRDYEIQASPLGIQRYVQGIQDINHPSIVVAEMVEDMALAPSNKALRLGIEAMEPLTVEALADIVLRVFLSNLQGFQHTKGLATIAVPYGQLVRNCASKLSTVYDILRVGEDGSDILTVDISDELNHQIRKLVVVIVSCFEIHLEEVEVEMQKQWDLNAHRVLNVTRSPALEKLLKNYDRFTTIHRPLLCKPRDWTSSVDGGYLTSSMSVATPYVKRASARRCHKLYSSHDLSKTMATSNKLQSVAYRVHDEVYNTVYSMVLGGIELPFMQHTLTREDGFYDELDIPTEYHGECPEDATEEFSKARAQFWVDYFDNKKEISSARGKELLGSSLMDMLYQYKGLDLYYVFNVDYRGRQYPLHTLLSPMGSKVARGFLRFAETKPVGTQAGASYLARHIANTAGHDKLPVDLREAWTYMNTDLLLSIAADPIGMREEWIHKDEPTEFLQGCFEWAGYTEQGFAFESSIKGAVDFATSGLGILASLTGDATSGKQTNLTDDSLQDIYSNILKKGISTLYSQLDNGELEDIEATSIEWLIEHHPDVFTRRELAKRAVMITPYDGKFISEYDEVKMLLRKWGIKDEMPTELFLPAVKAIARAIWASIPEEIGGAIGGMKWMKALVSSALRSDKAILPVYDEDGRDTGDSALQARAKRMMWTNGQGFPVYSDFRKEKKVDIQGADYAGNRVEFPFFVKTPIANVNKFKSSISANYIHSQDCAVLSRIVNSCDFEMSCIHDSFACHVADGPVMEAVIRDSYIQNFSDGEGVLQKLKDELVACAPDGFTYDAEIPWVGDLDLEEIRRSKYICH